MNAHPGNRLQPGTRAFVLATVLLGAILYAVLGGQGEGAAQVRAYAQAQAPVALHQLSVSWCAVNGGAVRDPGPATPAPRQVAIQGAPLYPNILLVEDGSFENGAPPASAWTVDTDAVDCESPISDWATNWGVGAYDGDFDFWAGGYCPDTPISNSVRQIVDVTTPSLSFRYMAYRPSGEDGVFDDYAYVKIDGVVVWYLPMVKDHDTFPNWVEATADLSDWLGQAVELRFGAVSDGNYTGNVRFDYIGFAGEPPTATPSATLTPSRTPSPTHTPTGTALPTFTIWPTAGANGTIAPAAPQMVNYGGSVTFAFTPSLNYRILDVLVDGASNPAAVTAGSYTFTNVMADHTIHVIFTQKGESTPTPTPTATPTRFSPAAPRVFLPLLLKPLLPDAPVLYAIAAPEANPSYRIYWTAAAGALRYTLERAASATFAGAVPVFTGAATEYIAPSEGIGAFYYRVKATHVTGDGPWSNVQSVEVRWELEPNGEPPQALLTGPLQPGSTCYGILTSTDDRHYDYFYFDLGAPHAVDLWLTNMAPGQNFNLTLYDAQVKFVGYSGEVGNASEHILTNELTAGRYYVRVSWESGESLQPYHLRGAW